jgi:hypothetical protein
VFQLQRVAVFAAPGFRLPAPNFFFTFYFLIPYSLFLIPYFIHLIQLVVANGKG